MYELNFTQLFHASTVDSTTFTVSRFLMPFFIRSRNSPTGKLNCVAYYFSSDKQLTSSFTAILYH